MSDLMPFTRREFLRSGLVMASAASTLPAFLHSSALALHRAAGGLSSVPGVPEEHILVVVQLGGGNDGLNTVVPCFAPEYYRARPGIGIPEAQVLKLPGADGVGLHPGMSAMREMYDEGLVSIVQGVGYPNPNRSHFKSMDIWHTADTTATGDGWLGRYFDAECCGWGKGESGTPEKNGGPPGIAIGRTAPLAMEGRQVKPVAFESPELFRWSGAEIGKELREGYEALNSRTTGEGNAARSESNAAFLLRTALDAQVSSDMIRRAVATRPRTQFPGTDLGRQLSMIASMIGAGLRTRVYYASMGSFDTHAGQGGQQGRHAQLLQQFSQAMQAFYRELKAQGNDGRVMTMAFSEFGRRVAQNQSQGTDHGTAAPMFLFGPMIRPGVHGEHPSLKDLDDGDLKYGIDFRSVYAGILESWLRADSRSILEGAWRAFPILAAAATSPAAKVRGR
jgi:uncharacterized protein (DUF1501 family)